MKKIIYLAFSMVMLVSCTNEDYLVDNGDNTLLTVSAVSRTGSTKMPVTRSVTPVISGSIGVFCLENNGYQASSNNEYHYNASSASWETDHDILLKQNDAHLCAYYPYQSSLLSAPNNPATLILTSQLATDENDICYATDRVVNSKSSNVKFEEMKHAYSKITFRITRDASCSGTCDISSISIIHNQLKTSSTLDIATGVYAEGVNGLVSFNPEITSIAKGDCVTRSLLMVPVPDEMTSSMVLSLVVDGKQMVAIMKSPDNRLLAGNNYQADITLTESKVLVEAIRITDWEEVNIKDQILTLPPSESNCYMVRPNSTVLIPVTSVNSAKQFLELLGMTGVPELPDNWTTEVLWSDAPNLLTPSGVVASVVADINAKKIVVTTGSKHGNAVVCIKDIAGNTLWSWHIWVTDYDVDAPGAVKNFSDFTWMDRNLGALSNVPATDVNDKSSYGLLYQWGRKDPFVSGNSNISSAPVYTPSGESSSYFTTTNVQVSNNILNAVINPTTFYCGSKWYTSDDEISLIANFLWGINKTIFDPCPQGWQVPYQREINSPFNPLITSSNMGVFSYGYTWNDPDTGLFPAAGRMNSAGSFQGVGQCGVYWFYNVVDYNNNSFEFSVNNRSLNSYFRTDGCSIRCVKQ